MRKLMLILPLLFVLSLFSVNAELSCDWVSPSSSGSLGNLSIFNVSFSADGNNTIISVIINASSSSTRNSTASTFIGNVSNATDDTAGRATKYVNLTFMNNVILEDSNDYTFTCSCENSTARTACNSTRTNVLVDRTKPSAPASVTFTNPLKDTDTITATIDRATANRCFIRFGSPNAETKAMTLSGSTCTFTVGKNNPPNSDYQAFIQADDRTNATLSAVQSVTIRAVQSDGGGLWGGTLVMNEPSLGQSVIAPSQNPFAPKNNNAVLALVIVILAFLYFRNKK